VGDKRGMERIHRIRALDNRHNFTLVCRDLSEISTYARVDNSGYRLLKSLTPGPYTFILRATHEVPRRLQNPKRKTIGIRVPDHPIALALLAELGEPLMSSTLILPGRDMPETDAWEIRERLEKDVDLVIDGGSCGLEPTTVIDLVDGVPTVVRTGCGPVDGLL
jgi:tRNA threonylcarbamoyl adenosine modification protein (Sua5/YciO/YrdC/YwlC family)